MATKTATTTYYGTGHRKNATAKVWLMPGAGNITVNEKPAREYFGRGSLDILVQQPFTVTDTLGKFDATVTALGGGLSGQAGAVRHGISKALIEANPDLRPVLRKLGLLTRDPRVKESKKYGRKRARRAFQFSKR
jgi:small subunit ribosomal protein S9